MTSFAACPTALVAEPAVRTLADARRGQRLLVGNILTPGPLGERLMELGLVPGTLVDVVGRGLFGGPLRLEVRGAILPLRVDHAKTVEAKLLF